MRRGALFCLPVSLGLWWLGAGAPAAAQGSEGKKIFEQQCAKCHGTGGKGDGPMAAALSPKPSDFTNPQTLRGKTDAQVEAVIRDGGAAHGLSKSMPSFKSVLTPEQIKSVAEHVESFAPGAKGGGTPR